MIFIYKKVIEEDLSSIVGDIKVKNFRETITTNKFDLNFAFLEYDDYIDGDGKELSGRDQAHAPNYQFSLGMDYDFADNWLLTLSMDGKDDFFVSDTPPASAFSQDELDAGSAFAHKTDSYVLFNASLSYYLDDWQLKVWARNVFDKDYYVRGFDSFGNDPRKFYAFEPYFQYGEPAVVGATINYSL